MFAHSGRNLDGKTHHGKKRQAQQLDTKHDSWYSSESGQLCTALCYQAQVRVPLQLHDSTITSASPGFNPQDTRVQSEHLSS